MKVLGPLDPSLTGVLASLTTALAGAGMSVCAISTYDTDYLLVRNGDLEKARQTLMEHGYRVRPERGKF